MVLKLAVALALCSLVACGDAANGPTPPLTAKVYVADEASGTVSIITASSGEVSATIDLSESGTMYEPHNIQVAPDGRSVWVVAPPAAGGGGHGHGEAHEQVVVLDPAKDEIIARIELGTGLHLAHVVVDDDSQQAYVTANETGAIFEIDVATRQVRKQHLLAAGAKPHGLRVCGGRLFIAGMDGGLFILDPATGGVERLEMGGMGVQTACTKDDSTAFISLFDTREVVRYELATGVLTRIALPADSQGPIQLYPSPDGLRLYVADQGVLLDRPASNRLYEIDLATNVVTHTIEVGLGAHGVVVSHDGASVYVTNLVDGTVSVVDSTSRAVAQTIHVGQSPNGISHFHVDGGCR